MRFRVMDNKTGKEADAYEIALHEEWAQGLVYCDMEGFAITENGDLMLADECGNFVYCDSERFKVVFEEERPHGEWIKGREILRTMLYDKTLHIDYENFTCSICGLTLDRLLYHVDGSPFYNFCPNCGAKMREGDEK